MARPPISLEQLRQDSRTFFESLEAEKPLQCALIAGAFLEKAVITLLTRFFTDSETSKDACDENKGALKDGFSRATLAYCLGLIPKITLENSRLLMRVRNRFAHSHLLIGFDDNEVAKLCGELKFSEPHTAELLELAQKFPNANRVRFEWAAAFAVAQIMYQTECVVKRAQCEHIELYSHIDSLIAGEQV